jgi:hypothetical protein
METVNVHKAKNHLSRLLNCDGTEKKQEANNVTQSR